jgi:transcriptional regulator with XRE-family HTH domain
MGRPPKTTRFHYIAERAARKKLTQADIAREVGADKSNVSRWFKGGIPSDMYLIMLAKFLTEDGEPASLFRHPDEDRSIRLTRGRSADEIDRIEMLVEIAFPKQAA